MPGGTGDEAPVAATSTRLMVWPSKTSLLGCHHSGAIPAAAGAAGTDEVPVQSQAWLLFQAVTALVAATAVSSRPTPRPTATARTTSRVIASRPPLRTSRSPRPTAARSRPARAYRTTSWPPSGRIGDLAPAQAGHA